MRIQQLTAVEDSPSGIRIDCRRPGSPPACQITVQSGCEPERGSIPLSPERGAESAQQDAEDVAGEARVVGRKGRIRFGRGVGPSVGSGFHLEIPMRRITSAKRGSR
jgi:hypothetical protein